MQEQIRCPKCGEIFQVDEAGYAAIVKQVRDKEFKKEIDSHEAALAARKEADIARIKAEAETDKGKSVASLNAEIAKLRESLKSAETEKELAVTQAKAARNDEISELTRKITELEASVKSAGTEKALAVAEAVEKKQSEIAGKEREIAELKLKNQGDKANFDIQIKMKDEEIERIKDFKAQQSTKLLGESLEQHCFNSFEGFRAAAFPTATFGKDNDASSGSKGDFIFRDTVDAGNGERVEYISIMFEMKNEADTTKTKQKNEQFFAELDKDRKEKKCEYAVLVSMLESDSDLYNQGIIDVSHRYEKMYVIRPQFFIPIITLLRNAAMKAAETKKELALVKAQNIDVSRFEEDLEAFKAGFGKNYDLAKKHFEGAIKKIDAAIKELNDVKDKLLASTKQLGYANDKAENLTVKKLTKNNPTMKLKFEEARAERERTVDEQK